MVVGESFLSWFWFFLPVFLVISGFDFEETSESTGFEIGIGEDEVADAVVVAFDATELSADALAYPGIQITKNSFSFRNFVIISKSENFSIYSLDECFF